MKKRYIKRMLLLAFLVALSGWGYAQNGSISGQVLDETNQPLPGASVNIRPLDRGASTNDKGQYRLNAIPNGVYTMSVTFIGYEVMQKQVTVKGDTQADFKLIPSSQNLNEVVVIGYGTQQKKDVTGSIATVGSRNFQRGTITSPEQLIAGKVAGVQITSSGGQPGSDNVIRIRGGASLNASNDPLIVVDGIPLAPSKDKSGASVIGGSANPLSLINPNDIETFTVLKDANATAIYGSRASNGVILITTKKGINGRPSVNFSTVNSVATIAKKVDVLSADQFRDYVNTNGSDAQKAMLGTESTDWQDVIYRNAYTTDNNLSVAGTVKNTPYRVSFGYLNQNGILIRDNMKRNTGAISISPKLLDNHLKIDLNIKGSMSESQFGNQGAIAAAVQFDPTKPIYADNNYGNYYEWESLDPQSNLITLNRNAPRNPLGLAELRDDQGKVNRSFGNLQLDYSLHFLPELHANLNVGYDVSRGTGNVFVPDYAAQNIANKGYSNRYKNDILNSVVEFYLNYNKKLTSIKSDINATAGYGYYNNKRTVYDYGEYSADGSSVVIRAPKFPFDVPRNRLLSYYGRLIYTLDDKYIVSGTIRADGSSRFSEDTRWGYFPSAAFTWRAIDEGFLKDTKVLSDLKLRLSYGVTGQQEGIDNYSYLPNYFSSNNESMYQLGNIFYYMSTPVAYDKDIKWETTETYNGGLDYGFLNGRINGSFDMYYKKTKDLLSRIPIPVGTNFSNQLLTNIGNMENKGVEFNINVNAVKQNDFSWDFGFNVTYNKSKVTNLTSVPDPNFKVEQGQITGGSGNMIQAHTVNREPFSFYVYKQVYDVSGKPLENVYADLNGDGVSNEGDLYFYKSPAPKVILGFTTSFNYKKWTLNTVLRSNLGNYVYDNVSSNFATGYNLLSPQGVINNSTTDLLLTDFQISRYKSDYYVKNASFLKMDNLGLIYNAGKIFKGSSANLTVSGNVQNVFTITDYEGIDPEVSNGIGYQLYPRPRTFVLGLNVGF